LEKYIEGRYRGERERRKRRERKNKDSRERHRSIDRGKEAQGKRQR
jgi:hypothetical protein